MADRIVRKIILDFVILACVACPSLCLYIWGRPYERGFFEADLSIRLPFREETIGDAVQAIAGFFLIIVTVLIVEVIRDRRGENLHKKYLAGTVVPGWLWETYTIVGVYCFGAAMQQLNSDCTKYVVGRLRPHFYDVCRPEYNATNPLNSLNYIQNFTCTTGVDLKEARLSFPSGHACFGTYTAVFFSCYIQVKWRWRGSKLLPHLLQFAAFLCAWFAGLTRIIDNYHHWDDVAFGILVGGIYGFLVFNYVLKPKKTMLPKVWANPTPQNILPRRWSGD